MTPNIINGRAADFKLYWCTNIVVNSEVGLIQETSCTSKIACGASTVVLQKVLTVRRAGDVVGQQPHMAYWESGTSSYWKTVVGKQPLGCCLHAQGRSAATNPEVSNAVDFVV